jgi:hypothetical protein
VTACRIFPLVAMLVAVSFAASAQFGGMPGLPGGPPAGVRGGGGFGEPPAGGPPPKCQALLAVRDELQKHGQAIQAANDKRADVKVACQLFKNYIATEAKMLRMLEADGAACGAALQIVQQVRGSHAKAQQIGRQICDAAARGPSPPGPSLYDALWEGFRKPGKFRDYEDNCDLCGKTGDFWWPGARLPGR